MVQSLHHDGVIAQSACGYAPPSLMYIRTLLDVPVPQFGPLVTGTGKPPAIVLVDSVILTWSLGQISSIVSIGITCNTVTHLQEIRLELDPMLQTEHHTQGNYYTR
jgi:hypothetical protein